MRDVYYQTLGALTPAQVTATDHMLGDLWTRIGQQNAIVAQARAAGFDGTLLNELTARGNALMARVEELSIQRDGISSAQYDQWRDRLQAFGQEVALFEESVRAQVGTSESTRNWKIVGSTVGALTVAGLVGAVIWYATKERWA